MSILIWSGATLSLIGIIGIIYSIVYVRRMTKGLDDKEKLQAVLSRILPVNLGSLVLSAIGLMIVVAGILIG